jgi:D-glycero-D-manno-heptose 1,7-bisphosphate phosphatase
MFDPCERRKAVFLDRDGVINKRAKEHEHIKSWGEFEFLPNVAETIRELNKEFLVVMISNQGGIAKGVMSEQDLEEIHSKMETELKKNGARIDKIYFCPHADNDNCSCRKPMPGMLLRAAEELNIDLADSFMVGDSISDIKAGKSAGCKTILINNSKNVGADYVISSLSEIMKIVVR